MLPNLADFVTILGRALRALVFCKLSPFLRSKIEDQIMMELKKIFIGVTVAIAVLLALAIVIPNLQRSQISPGHGAQPQQTIRSLNTTQVSCLMTYPKLGYAPNLAVLGPDAANYSQCHPTQTLACLVDPKLACLSLWHWNSLVREGCVSLQHSDQFSRASTQGFLDYRHSGSSEPETQELLLAIRCCDEVRTSSSPDSSIHT